VLLVSKYTDKYHVHFLLDMREMGDMMSGLTTDTKNVQHGESKTVDCIKNERQN